MSQNRTRRDPQEPKSVASKRRAIERSIQKLAASALDSRERLPALQKIQRAIERYERDAFYKEGYEPARETGRMLWRQASDAFKKAEENYTTYLQEQLRSSQKAYRESQARIDPYEKELRVHGGGTRKVGLRDASRSARDRASFRSTREARVFQRTLSDSGYPSAVVGEDREGAFALYPNRVPADVIRRAEESARSVGRHLRDRRRTRKAKKTSRKTIGTRRTTR